MKHSGDFGACIRDVTLLRKFGVLRPDYLDKYLQQSLVLIYSQQLAWLPSILKSFARSTSVMRDGSHPFLGVKTFSFN